MILLAVSDTPMPVSGLLTTNDSMRHDFGAEVLSPRLPKSINALSMSQALYTSRGDIEWRGIAGAMRRRDCEYGTSTIRGFEIGGIAANAALISTRHAPPRFINNKLTPLKRVDITPSPRQSAHSLNMMRIATMPPRAQRRHARPRHRHH